jgi:hypothetical protein
MLFVAGADGGRPRDLVDGQAGQEHRLVRHRPVARLGFGLLRGVALACVAVLLLRLHAAAAGDPWWRESRSLPGFQRGAEWLPMCGIIGIVGTQ